MQEVEWKDEESAGKNSGTRVTYGESRRAPSYLVMVINAILSSAEKMLLLQDIYLFIKENYPEVIEKHVSWQNSVRHNLSTHGCFYKARKFFGQGASFWGIHHTYIPYFQKGDYTRRWPMGPKRRQHCWTEKELTYSSPSMGPMASNHQEITQPATDVTAELHNNPAAGTATTDPHIKTLHRDNQSNLCIWYCIPIMVNTAPRQNGMPATPTQSSQQQPVQVPTYWPLHNSYPYPYPCRNL